MRGLFFTAALMLVFPAPAPAQVISIYLHPRAACGALTLGDIADVEGDAGTVEALAVLPVDASLWSDGFIDRGEILSLLENASGPSYCVYGSAVRVEGAGADVKTAAVTKGADVTVIVVKKGVRLRLRGKALEQGNTGDTVKVRTASNAVLEGRVIKNGTVEKTL